MTEKEKFNLLLNECIEIYKQLPSSKQIDRFNNVRKMFLRQILSAHSIYSLSDSNTTGDNIILKGNPIYDYSSVWTILRVMFENACVAHYVFIDSENQRIRNVIFHLANLHAVRELRTLAKYLPLEAIEIQQNITREKELEDTIRNHIEFQYLTHTDKNWVNKQNKRKEWYNNDYDFKKLGIKAGFDESKVSFLYKLASNYTHSDPLSWGHVEEFNLPGDSEKLFSLLYNYCLNFLSCSLYILRIVFKEEKNEGIYISMLAEGLIQDYRNYNKADLSKRK